MAGTNIPDPRTPVQHRPLVVDGTAFTNGTPVSVDVAVHGARYVTSRILTATGGGTLASAFLRRKSDGTLEAYTTDNPSDVTVAAGTENDTGEITCGGQAFIRFTFTPSANGTFTRWDVYGL